MIISIRTQYREASCVVVRRDIKGRGGSDGSTAIPTSLCLDSLGLARPETVRECGAESGPCPKWRTRRWSKCRESKCLARNTGKLGPWLSTVTELHCVYRAWLNCRSQVWRILFLLLLTSSA